MNGSDFERNFMSHSKALHAYARAICSTPEMVEDIVQETFLRAWKYLDSYSGRGSFEGWLLRICRNCTIDIAHSRSTTEPLEEDPQLGADLDRPHEIMELIACLPLTQREVLVLCGLLGYDYEGAAAILGVPVGTVRSRLSRGRTNLAQLLTETECESA